ncbi:phage morphogenesis protein [Gallibacterium anatis]|uniref:phage morphogenesis protein n=1 Tax=Gallibacterium anatis TaxID=750 RepID=UPI0030055DFB
MTEKVGLTAESIKSLKRTVKLLSLPKEKKTKLLKMALKQIKDEAKEHIKKQETPDGKKWAERRSGSNKKMYRRRGTLLNIIKNDGNEAKLGYRGKKNQLISVVQHYGQEMTVSVNARTLEKLRRQLASQSDPCSTAQARKLKSLGYKIKNKKGKEVSPSIKSIQARLTKGQAGLIARILKNKNEGGKKGTPARPALNTNTQHNAEILTEVIEKVLKI